MIELPGVIRKELVMKSRVIWSIINATLLCIPVMMQSFGEKTFFSTRSQSVDAVRDLVGLQQEIHLYNQDHCYGTIALTIEYNRSFQTKKIAQFLFGSEQLFFSGSKVENRGKNAILADYFGLPFCYQSCVKFEPRISNFIFDFNWYQSLDCVLDGAYVQVHLPMVQTKWDLHLNEKILDDGTEECGTYTFYPAGYMSQEQLTIATSLIPEPNNLSISVQEAFEGLRLVGDRDPLQFGRIFGRQTRSRFSDLQLIFGWDFLLENWYYAGASLRIAVPTGNRPTCEFLFESICGNGHHWELGAGFDGFVRLWQSTGGVHTLALYADANITHLFTDRQNRSYDLKNNGTGSRYMLIQDFGSGAADFLLSSTGPAASVQYTGRLLPAVNATTLKSDISIGVQADIVVKLAYQRSDGFEFDFGYNFWARSKEKVHCRARFPDNRYVIKGDAQVYGFVQGTQEPIRLSASQSKATLYAAQPDTNFVAGQEFRNFNADNPVGVFDDTGLALNQLNDSDAMSLDVVQAQIDTSSPTVFLSDADINEFSGILPKAISHKLFFHCDKTWHEKPGIKPYLGAGASVEWACSCVCNNSAYSQWAMWLKGGLSY
jgi:hypothetical protein